MKTKKELLRLTLDDLGKHSIWKYDIENKIEIVESANPEKISERDNDVYIILTEFETFDKSKYWGYSSPQDNSGLDYVQPVIIYRDNHIKLWFDKAPKKCELERQWNILGKTEEQIFPLKYKCVVDIDEEERKGIIYNIEYEES
jgi:hypothetical protein